MRQKFTIFPANDTFWNRDEFIDFLATNQGQPIEIDTSSEGPCLDTIGVYRLLEQFKYTDVVISTWNLLEHHKTFQIKQLHPFYYFKIFGSTYEKYHTWTKSKIFGCFYNRPLWYRIGLAATLQQNYSDDSVINVRCSANDNDNRMLFEVQKLFEMHTDSFVDFANVFKTWPIQLEPVDTYGFCNTPDHTSQLAEFYNDLLIDIVAETWVTGRTFYPTEKTVRPMLLKKPFIIMGSRNYLDYLHQMGFKTFNDFWDEDYDGYDNQDRYIKILKLIDDLSKKSPAELQQMYQGMQHVLDHNYNLLLNQTYLRDITYIP